jgi:hypothetical protein
MVSMKTLQHAVALPEESESMEYLIGCGLAVVVCLFATLVGFDRDHAFYPTLVTVITSYYILFAVIGSSTRALFPRSPWQASRS